MTVSLFQLKKIMKYQLNKNEYNFEHSDLVKHTIADFNSDSICRYSEESSERVYTRLASFHNVQKDGLVIGAGLESVLIDLLLRIKAQLNINKLILPNFSWAHYSRMGKSCIDSNPVFFHTTKEKNHFKYNLDSLDRMLKKLSPATVLIGSPNNPTGHSITFSEIDDIMKQYSDSMFIIDEAYCGYGKDSFESTEFIQHCQKVNNLIVGRTFSKFFGLAGLRFGYATMSCTLASQLGITPHYLGINRLTEEVVLSALEDSKFYTKQAQRMKKIRDKFIYSLNQCSYIKAYESDANFVLIESKKITAKNLQESLLEHGFVIKGFTEDSLRNCIRVTIGEESLMIRLSSLIKHLAKEGLSIQ